MWSVRHRHPLPRSTGKAGAIQPTTLGQASKFGVSQADTTALLMWLEPRQRSNLATARKLDSFGILGSSLVFQSSDTTCLLEPACEQVMDKVFEQDAFDAGERHLMAVDVAVEDPTPIQTTKPKPAEWKSPRNQTCGYAMLTEIDRKCSELRLADWQLAISQSQLEQERNLLLVERLRQNITQAKEPMATAGQPRQATLSDLPPPTTEQPSAQQPTAQQPDAISWPH